MFGQLHVFVENATFTKNLDTFGKMDPYVKLTLNQEVKKTTEANGGGQQPTWNEKLTYDIKQDATMLFLEAFDKDVDSDDIIGSCLINLMKFLTSTNIKISHTAKIFNLGQSLGEVNLSFQYVPNESQIAKYHADNCKQYAKYMIINQITAKLNNKLENAKVKFQLNAKQDSSSVAVIASSDNKSFEYKETFEYLLTNQQNQLTVQVFNDKSNIGSAKLNVDSLQIGKNEQELVIKDQKGTQVAKISAQFYIQNLENLEEQKQKLDQQKQQDQQKKKQQEDDLKKQQEEERKNQLAAQDEQKLKQSQMNNNSQAKSTQQQNKMQNSGGSFAQNQSGRNSFQQNDSYNAGVDDENNFNNQDSKINNNSGKNEEKLPKKKFLANAYLDVLYKNVDNENAQQEPLQPEQLDSQIEQNYNQILVGKLNNLGLKIDVTENKFIPIQKTVHGTPVDNLLKDRASKRADNALVQANKIISEKQAQPADTQFDIKDIMEKDLLKIYSENKLLKKEQEKIKEQFQVKNQIINALVEEVKKMKANEQAMLQQISELHEQLNFTTKKLEFNKNRQIDSTNNVKVIKNKGNLVTIDPIDHQEQAAVESFWLNKQDQNDDFQPNNKQFYKKNLNDLLGGKELWVHEHEGSVKNNNNSRNRNFQSAKVLPNINENPNYYQQQQQQQYPASNSYQAPYQQLQLPPMQQQAYYNQAQGSQSNNNGYSNNYARLNPKYQSNNYDPDTLQKYNSVDVKNQYNQQPQQQGNNSNNSNSLSKGNSQLKLEPINKPQQKYSNNVSPSQKTKNTYGKQK